MFSDTLIESFEDFCSDKDVIHAKVVRQYLSANLSADQMNSDFMWELAKIAMELSWMRWPARLSEGLRSCSIEEVLQNFRALPRAADFVDSQGSTIAANSLARDLFASEYRLRSLFGDNPHLEYFRERYGISLHPLQARTAPHVSSDFRNGTLKTIALHGLCRFGRQRSFEADDTFTYATSAGQRIVVAARDELRVSRKQMSVQLLCPGFAVLQNTSSTNRLRITSVGILERGESQLVQFPFVVVLPNQRLRFYVGDHASLEARSNS